MESKEKEELLARNWRNRWDPEVCACWEEEAGTKARNRKSSRASRLRSKSTSVSSPVVVVAFSTVNETPLQAPPHRVGQCLVRSVRPSKIRPGFSYWWLRFSQIHWLKIFVDLWTHRCHHYSLDLCFLHQTGQLIETGRKGVAYRDWWSLNYRDARDKKNYEEKSRLNFRIGDIPCYRWGKRATGGKKGVGGGERGVGGTHSRNTSYPPLPTAQDLGLGPC